MRSALSRRLKLPKKDIFTVFPDTSRFAISWIVASTSAFASSTDSSTVWRIARAESARLTVAMSEYSSACRLKMRQARSLSNVILALPEDPRRRNSAVPVRHREVDIDRDVPTAARSCASTVA